MSAGNLIGAIAGAIWGPWGFFLGALAGNLLFPPSSGVSGPRLEVGVTRSEYGRPLRIIYGTVAVPGDIIGWHSWVVEGDSGGKGDDVPTPDKAYASFAVALGEGHPDLRLGRIWFGPEKRLVWDGVAFEGGATVTFYNGSEDQMPDPLMESFLGVGNVPAYRGTAYMVISNFPLEKDGNRAPFITAEVGRSIDQRGAVSLGTVTIRNTIITDEFYMVFYDGSNNGVVIRYLSNDRILYKHYSTAFGDFADEPFYADGWFWDKDRRLLVQFRPPLQQFTTMDIATGVRVTYPITPAASPESNYGMNIRWGIYYRGSYIFAATGSAGASSRVTLHLVDPATHETTATFCQNGAGDFRGPLIAPLDGSAYVYGWSYPDNLYRYELAPGGTATNFGAHAGQANQTAASAEIDPYTGNLWTAYKTGPDNIRVTVHKPPFTGAMETTDITTTAYPIRLAWAFVPAGYAILSGVGSTDLTDKFWMFDANNGLPYIPPYEGATHEQSTNYRGSGEIMALDYNPITGDLMAFRRNGWVSYGDWNDPVSVNFFSYVQPGVQEADNFYLGRAYVSITPEGQPLDEIVLDLSLRAGLTADQMDVTALADDLVDGYALTDQMSVRDAITALMPVYYFDLVESEGKVKAVKRGGAATLIPDDDVGCFEQGSDPADPMETTRKKENDLPRSLTVKYIQQATNYSTAAKNAKRLIGASGDERTMECPLVLTDTKAQEVAEVNLHGAWVARITYKFTLTRKWSHLEPTDVVIVYGYTMRLTKTIQKDGVIECEATAEDAPLYTPNVIVTETPPIGGGVDIPATLVLEIA